MAVQVFNNEYLFLQHSAQRAKYLANVGIGVGMISFVPLHAEHFTRCSKSNSEKLMNLKCMMLIMV